MYFLKLENFFLYLLFFLFFISVQIGHSMNEGKRDGIRRVPEKHTLGNPVVAALCSVCGCDPDDLKKARQRVREAEADNEQLKHINHAWNRDYDILKKSKGVNVESQEVQPATNDVKANASSRPSGREKLFDETIDEIEALKLHIKEQNEENAWLLDCKENSEKSAKRQKEEIDRLTENIVGAEKVLESVMQGLSLGQQKIPTSRAPDMSARVFVLEYPPFNPAYHQTNSSQGDQRESGSIIELPSDLVIPQNASSNELQTYRQPCYKGSSGNETYADYEDSLNGGAYRREIHNRVTGGDDVITIPYPGALPIRPAPNTFWKCSDMDPDQSGRLQESENRQVLMNSWGRGEGSVVVD